jgi:hypothetical protein
MFRDIPEPAPILIHFQGGIMNDLLSCLQEKNHGMSGFKCLRKFVTAGILMSLPLMCVGYATASSMGSDYRSNDKQHQLRVAILPNEITFGDQVKTETIRSIKWRLSG